MIEDTEYSISWITRFYIELKVLSHEILLESLPLSLNQEFSSCPGIFRLRSSDTKTLMGWAGEGGTKGGGEGAKRKG